jgi:hypothetical protein
MAVSQRDERIPGLRDLLHRALLSAGEGLSAASALALVVVMFAFRWYGTVALPRAAQQAGMSSAENAWHALAVVRWLMLLTVLGALAGALVLTVPRLETVRLWSTSTLAGLATLTAAVLAYRVLIDPPAAAAVVDVKLGGYLGLLCSVGIALGAHDSLRRERDRLRSVRLRSDRLRSVTDAR